MWESIQKRKDKTDEMIACAHDKGITCTVPVNTFLDFKFPARGALYYERSEEVAAAWEHGFNRHHLKNFCTGLRYEKPKEPVKVTVYDSMALLSTPRMTALFGGVLGGR